MDLGLAISDKRKSDQSQIILTIYLPGKALEELDVEMGAGALYADQLQVREFGLEVGAGECIIDSLTVSESAELHVDAGRIQVDRFDGCYLDGECGAGELDLTLSGVYEDYNYEVEVAMGEISLGENSYGGLANEQSIRNGADKNVELECAMGSISVGFDDK